MSGPGANIRAPAVAGAFYPGEPGELAALVDELVNEALAGRQRGTREPPKAIIAPHAGYIYSGPIAASAYARFAPARNRISQIVLLGPAHRVPFQGLAVPSAEGFATPLGVVPVDHAAINHIVSLPQAQVLDEAHAAEHSLEVHLPFLQRMFRDFTLVPLVVGAASPADVAEVLRTLWNGPETLIVVSSDLSHYHDYETARRLDGETARAIGELDGDGISDEGACGRAPIRGLLVEAKRLGLSANLIDLRNSGDTAGARDRVVGYASFLFGAEAGPKLTTADKRELLGTAGAAIRMGFRNGERAQIDLSSFSPNLMSPGASFITLTKDGKLRGCVGSLQAKRPLIADIAWNAYGAAFEDRRFEPVAESELGALELSASLLSPPLAMDVESEDDLLTQLRPGIDGLLLVDGDHRGTFLPKVWDQLPDASAFLTQLKVKAGLAPDHWSDSLKVWRYTVVLSIPLNESINLIDM